MDETKKYLINIESNLKQYADDAAAAKKKADELKVSNELLKKSGASAAEIEANNAALRNANKEYSNAKKLIDLATQANKAQAGSYEQLYRNHQLLQTALKLEGGLMTKNADGTYQLTDKYIRLSKEVDEAKKGLDAFGKGIHDNRLNVGNYSEAIQGALGGLSQMPGSVGNAAKAVSSFGTTAKAAGTALKTAFISNPIGIAVAAIVAVVGALVGIFKKFTPVIEAVERAMAGIKAVFSGVSNTIIALVTGQKTLGESFKGLGSSIKQAYEEGVKWRQLQQDLFEMTTENAVLDAKRKTQMDELLLASRNRTKSEAERSLLIDQALLLEEVQFAERKKIADAEVQLARDKMIAGKNFTESEKKELDRRGVAYANEMKMKKNITEEEIKAYSDALVKQEQLNNEDIALREKAQNRQDQINEKAEQERQKALEKAQKIRDKLREQDVAWNKEQDAFIAEWVKRWDDEAKAKQEQEQKDFEDFIRYWDKEDRLAVERQILNDANRLRTLEIRNANEFEIQRANLKLQYDEEIKAARKVGADIEIINKNYALAQRKINEAELDYKLGLVSSFTNALADLLGQQTAIGKAAAIATTTMDTYVAAQKAYKTNMDIPPAPVWGVIAAAAAIVAGLGRVRQIMSISTNMRSGSTAAPTSMSTSTPHVPVPATTILTPQLSQGQLNAVPNSGALNAADIASAVAKEFSKIPPPIVSVEAYEKVAKNKTKVEIRANI